MNQPPVVPRRTFLNRYFTFLERRTTGDRFIFHLVLAIFLTSLIVVGLEINDRYLTETPVRGGTLVEGVVGTPRFVNPVLAVTRADQDMVALVYRGLMKLDEQGNIVPDLATTVSRSEDGRTYNVTLRQDAFFHDGSPVTARDVAFTIALIQNPELKSPLRGNWNGVTVTEVNEHELTITLAEAYTPFIENLTVGIIPRAVWENIPTEQLPFSQYNTEPVGAGRFFVDDITRDKNGLINSYTLTATPDQSGTVQVKHIIMRFYGNEEQLLTALKGGSIDSTPSLSAETLAALDTTGMTIREVPLPRTFGLFFNQNKSAALLDPAVREALAVMIDRDELVKKVVHGHGIPTSTPVPPGFTALASTSTGTTTPDVAARATEARAILETAKWTQGEDKRWVKEINGENVTLSLTISTSNTPLFDATAHTIREWWEALGVEVAVDQYEQTDLVQTIIRPRNFQVLLFGNDVGRGLDLYPFWHSSQKDDPGLNITQYTNIDADAYLKTIRTTGNEEEQRKAISALITLISSDRPAIFLFTPTFTYLSQSSITMPPLVRLGTPSDRFANIGQWYVNKENLWPFFSNQHR